MSKTVTSPLVVGRYRQPGGWGFLPMSHSEMVRAAAAYEALLRGFDIAPGRFILITSMQEEVVQFAPLELASSAVGLKLANTDAGSYEARRLEAALRHFDIAIVAGVTGALLDGLAELGHDPAALFAGRIVWARADAYQRLVGQRGIRLLHWLDLGPVVAAECRDAIGAHLDPREWSATVEDGQISLSNQLPRLEPFAGHPTGVAGTIERQPCSCGLSWPRIRPMPAGKDGSSSQTAALV